MGFPLSASSSKLEVKRIGGGDADRGGRAARGPATSAIRYYETAGLLPAPDRTSGRRSYDDAVLSRLAVIRFAQAGAFSLAEIRQLFSARPGEQPISARWKRLAAAKLVELDAVIARAEAMKRGLREALRCGCVEVEECGRALLGKAPRGDPAAVRSAAPARGAAPVRGAAAARGEVAVQGAVGRDEAAASLRARRSRAGGR